MNRAAILHVVVFVALFMFPFLSFASTLANSPAVPIDGLTNGIPVYLPTDFVATGTPATVVSYVAYSNLVATSGENYVLRLSIDDGSTYGSLRDCESAAFTPTSLSLPEGHGSSPASFGDYRLIAVSGSQCTMDWSIASTLYKGYHWYPYPSDAAGTPIANPDGGIRFGFASTYHSSTNTWYLVTDDNISSTIYEYQATKLGIATSTSFAFCNTSFATSSGLVSDFANGFSNGLCQVAGFLIVPAPATLEGFSSLTSTAREKIPFSYYYDILGVVNGSSASTTQNLPSYGLDLSVLDFSSSTAMGPLLPTGIFSIFSSSTIERFLPAGLHDLLYNMMIWAIWGDLMWVLYHKIVPSKAKI
jgi:hypothetical protein